jgi:hypothetical protein
VSASRFPARPTGTCSSCIASTAEGRTARRERQCDGAIAGPTLVAQSASLLRPARDRPANCPTAAPATLRSTRGHWATSSSARGALGRWPSCGRTAGTRVPLDGIARAAGG